MLEMRSVFDIKLAICKAITLSLSLMQQPTHDTHCVVDKAVGLVFLGMTLPGGYIRSLHKAEWKMFSY